MKGSEFVALFKDKGIGAWEAAAFEMANRGGAVDWPMVPVQLSFTSKDGTSHTGVVRVASDLFAVGEPTDFLRLPLAPSVAQSVANLKGYLLPTPKLALEIWKQAKTHLRPKTFWPNKADNLLQFAEHDAKVQAQLLQKTQGQDPGLVTGHKKDVVVSNIYRPGYVLIYGWFWPPGTKPSETEGHAQPIQARSNIHVVSHVDYSHGVRFVHPMMEVDGQPVPTEVVYQDPELSKLVSDEGPVRMIRYPSKVAPAPYKPDAAADHSKIATSYSAPLTTSLADQGVAILLSRTYRRP